MNKIKFEDQSQQDQDRIKLYFEMINIMNNALSGEKYIPLGRLCPKETDVPPYLKHGDILPSGKKVVQIKKGHLETVQQ